MDRREFLLLTGVAGGAAALTPLLYSISSEADNFQAVIPGVESWVSTACLMCPGGCGLRVRRVDGFPIAIQGNPNHPINAGGVCTEGMASLQSLYHPDRLLNPMGRISLNRANAFEQLSWDQALDRIGSALKELRRKDQARHLGFVLGRTGGSMGDLVKHFMATWGSPHLFVDEPQDGYAQVLELMHGQRMRPAFDFDTTGLVLSFGADLLDAWQSPLQFQRSYAEFRAPARSSPAGLIVADVRFSRTAAQANEWVGVAPGSYAALALGIAYVMLREKLYDIQFVGENLFGFEDFRDRTGKLRTGYRNLVLQEYSPEVVSRLTGVPVERILALGKTFGESPTAVALFDENVAAQPGGLHAAMAIHSLNLLKGNLNRPGGIYLQPEVPLRPLSANDAPVSDASGIRVLEDLVELDAVAGSLDMLFLYYSNPVYSSPMGRRLQEVLKKIPFVVSFSPFLDETSRFVDLILPDCLPLERWEDRRFPSSSPMPGWSVVQPCVKAAGQTRHSGDVLLDLTRRLGSPLAEAFPWKTFEELIKHRAHGLFESRSGTLCGDPFRQGLLGEMERRGWWLSEAANFEEFWQSLLEAGAWADLNFQVRGLGDYSGNGDGKIDLHSRRLEEKHARSTPPIADVECLPHYHAGDTAPAAANSDMYLNTYRLGKLGGGTNGALPWILQRAGLLQRTSWNSWVEIHPADAQRLGIGNMDWVWVESPSGKIKIRAVIYPGTGRGSVSIPCGLGHSDMGRWARERGVNPLGLLAGERDPLTGLSYRFGAKVKVYRA